MLRTCGPIQQATGTSPCDAGGGTPCVDSPSSAATRPFSSGAAGVSKSFHLCPSISMSRTPKGTESAKTSVRGDFLTAPERYGQRSRPCVHTSCSRTRQTPDGSEKKDGQQNNKGEFGKRESEAYVDGRQVGGGCAVIEDLDASYRTNAAF